MSKKTVWKGNWRDGTVKAMVRETSDGKYRASVKSSTFSTRTFEDIGDAVKWAGEAGNAHLYAEHLYAEHRNG